LSAAVTRASPYARHFFPFDRGYGGVREVVPLQAAVSSLGRS
jgi:hypothetical protein